MKEIVKTVRLKVFVSSDGKEFTSRVACDNHERRLRDKQDEKFARHRYLLAQISYLKMVSLPEAHKEYLAKKAALAEELRKSRKPRARIIGRHGAYRNAHTAREGLEKLIATLKKYHAELVELGGILYQNRGKAKA